MRKIIELEDYFPTGEQTVQPVLLWGVGRNRQDLSHITKTASEALDYIKHVVPEPGMTQMLVLAMAGEETYGSNKNGDGFPARPVPARRGRGWWIAPGQELTKHYQSFERNPAHTYRHHQNKDPAKASGVVKKAFWNDRMQRVELLISVANEKDPEWVQRVSDGDFPPVSMGVRIKYDVCSRCGNRAPTRAQYCDDIKFGMNQIGPDGIKNYVHNPDIDGFDLSRVLRPAERTGYTLKKVAQFNEVWLSADLGETVHALETKSAALRKLSDIDKIVRGEPVATASNLAPREQVIVRRFRDYISPRLGAAPALPIAELIAHHPAEVLSTLSSMGIVLTTPEFLRFMVSKLAGRPVALDDAAIRQATALQPQVFALLAESPQLLDELLSTGVLDEHPDHVDARIRERLAPYTEKRSAADEMLYRRLVPEGIGIRPDEAPRTDVLDFHDPATGHAYRTTRGAAIDAHDAVTRTEINRLVGGAALLGGAYKALTAFPSLRKYKLPLGLGAGLAGWRLLRPSAGSTLHADQGIGIPDITEWSPQPKQAADNLPAIVVALLDDYRTLNSLTAPASKVALDDSVTRRGYVDHLKGLCLNLDAVAGAIGNLLAS